MSKEMIRILVADDHEMILRGLADGIRDHPDFEWAAAIVVSLWVSPKTWRISRVS